MILRYFNIFFLIFFFGCSSQLSLNNKSNYTKTNNFQEVKLPFEEKDFLSSNLEFFQIVNTKNLSLNLAKQRAQTSAKALLSQKINTYIVTVANQDLSFQSNKEIENFNLRSKSFSILLADNLKLVDSRIFKSKSGEYEYWAVFSLKLNDVKDLNKSQTILSSNEYNNSLKQTVKSDLNLEATENTQPNNYLNISGTNENDLREKIETESKAYLGIPYVWGGNNPEEGFDCSGYVRWVYKKSTNKLIARTTLQHSTRYKDIINYDLKKSKKGDLIYFKTLPNRKISHVGIYLGNNQFIHAPNKNENVKIDFLNGYWLRNYVGYASVTDF